MSQGSNADVFLIEPYYATRFREHRLSYGLFASRTKPTPDHPTFQAESRASAVRLVLQERYGAVTTSVWDHHLVDWLRQRGLETLLRQRGR